MSLADKISAVRIVLIPVFVSLLIYSREHPVLRWYALAVFILAVLSDFFDGLVARLKKEKSDLGQIIDPVADKLLMLAAFLSLYLLPNFDIYLWVVLVVVSRDLIILLGVIILHALKIDINIQPTMWGKFTTFFQMAVILWVLIGFPYHFYICLLAVIFTVVSGINYFWRGIREVNAKANFSHK